MRRASPFWRYTVVVSLAAQLGACSVATHAPLRAVVPGSGVLVETQAPQGVDLEAYDSLGGAGSGALRGTGGGALVGAGVGAQATAGCGPAAALCSLVVIGTAAIGAVVGGVGGTMHGAITGLPGDKARAFSEQAVRTYGNVDLTADLRKAFNDKAGQVWVIAAGTGGATTLLLQLESLHFVQYPDDELALAVTASVTVTYESVDGGRESTKRHLFSFESPRSGVDQWLAEDDALMLDAARAGIDDVTSQMIEYLQEPSA